MDQHLKHQMLAFYCVSLHVNGKEVFDYLEDHMKIWRLRKAT